MKGRTLKRMAIKALIFARKATPYVLAALSAAGTVAVTVEAVKEIKKNTPKVYYAKQDDTVEELDKKSEEGTEICILDNNTAILKRKLVDSIKAYWKPITFCAGSLACQFGSVFIFTKRQQQLIIATHQMETLLRKYTEAATATAGIGGTAVLNKLAPELSPIDTPPFDADDDGKMLFWDPYFDDGISKGYWFRAKETDFLEAARDSMHCFVANGVESIENFYTRMNVSPPMDHNGDGYIGWGWIANEKFVSDWCEYAYDIYICFSDKMTTDDGLEYRVVCYDKPPWFDREILLSDCKHLLNIWY